MEIPTQPTRSSDSATDLEAAQEAFRRGDRQLARQLSAQVVARNPADDVAWLLLASSSDSLNERIGALGELAKLNPNHAAGRQAFHQAMGELLRQDPALIYQGETQAVYHLRTAADLQFSHPKYRASAESYPPASPRPAHAAWRWLAWSVIGLVPAGLGALICAPAAMFLAIRLLLSRPDDADSRRAWIILFSAGAVWVAALSLLILIILHLV